MHELFLTTKVVCYPFKAWNSVTNPGLNTEALIFSELTFAVSYTTPVGDFPLTASLKQLVDITAFSKSVQLSVTHLFDIQMLMTSDPVGSSNTEEEICIMFLFDVQTTVQNSGPFFEALPSIQEIFVLEQDFTPANVRAQVIFTSRYSSHVYNKGMPNRCIRARTVNFSSGEIASVCEGSSVLSSPRSDPYSS